MHHMNVLFMHIRAFVCFLGLLLYATPSFATEPLVVGVENKDWPGHYTWKDGELRGIDADIVRLAAEHVGIKVRFKGYPWKRVLYMAKEKQLDAVLDIAPTKQREYFLHYVTTPISKESTVFWIPANSTFSFNGTLSPNLALGLMQGSDWSDRFRKHGTPKVYRFNDYMAAFSALAAGRIDCFGGHLTPTKAHVHRLGFSGKIRPSQPTIDNLDYFLAFSQKKGHKELAESFSAALKQVFASKEYTDLYHAQHH